MVGISKNSVMLYPYSEEWSMLFEKEKINIYNCIKEYVIDIQHVGSTSIRDMHSKPIIDIVVAIYKIYLKEAAKININAAVIIFHLLILLIKPNLYN